MPKLNSAAMKKILLETRPAVLANGGAAQLQHSGVIFNGRIITDVKDVPSDDEIAKAEQEVTELRKQSGR